MNLTLVWVGEVIVVRQPMLDPLASIAFRGSVNHQTIVMKNCLNTGAKIFHLLVLALYWKLGTFIGPAWRKLGTFIGPDPHNVNANLVPIPTPPLPCREGPPCKYLFDAEPEEFFDFAPWDLRALEPQIEGWNQGLRPCSGSRVDKAVRKHWSLDRATQTPRLDSCQAPKSTCETCGAVPGA